MKPITAKCLSSACGAALFCCLFAVATQAADTLGVPPLDGAKVVTAKSVSAKTVQAKQNMNSGSTVYSVSKGNMPGNSAASKLAGSGGGLQHNLNFTTTNTVQGNVNAANSAKVNIGGLDLSKDGSTASGGARNGVGGAGTNVIAGNGAGNVTAAGSGVVAANDAANSGGQLTPLTEVYKTCLQQGKSKLECGGWVTYNNCLRAGNTENQCQGRFDQDMALARKADKLASLWLDKSVDAEIALLTVTKWLSAVGIGIVAGWEVELGVLGSAAVATAYSTVTDIFQTLDDNDLMPWIGKNKVQLSSENIQNFVQDMTYASATNLFAGIVSGGFMNAVGGGAFWGNKPGTPVVHTAIDATTFVSKSFIGGLSSGTVKILADLAKYDLLGRKPSMSTEEKLQDAGPTLFNELLKKTGKQFPNALVK